MTKRYTVRKCPGLGWAIFDNGVQMGTVRGPFWSRRGMALAAAAELEAKQ